MHLPSGWASAKLFDVAQINPPNPDAPPSDSTLVSFVPMAAVEELSGRLDPSATRPWGEVKKGYTRFQNGDVVVAKITPSMENGKAAYAVGLWNGVGTGTTEFHVLRPRPEVNGRFLLHYVLQDSFRRSARARMTGTAGQLRVPTTFLQEQCLPLPPAREQTRIVDAIESYLSRTDDAIAGLQRAQARLKAYRASVLKAAVEGRLVPTEAELARAEKRGFEPADVLLKRILAERRRRWEKEVLARLKVDGKQPRDERWKERYEEPALADTNALPELPEGWCWATVDQLAAHEDNSLCDGPFGSNLKTSHYTATGPRVIRLQNIGDGVFVDEQAHISEAHYARLRRHEVKAGDLIIASLGSELPRVCRAPSLLGPAIVKADCLRFSVHESLAEPSYVMHALNSTVTRKRTERLIHGVGRPRIGLTLMRTIPVPLPPRAEQQRIAESIEAFLSIGTVVTTDIQRQGDRAERLRASILAWAFDGKLVDQDPSEEPAVALLTRIRSAHKPVGMATNNRALKTRVAS